MRLAILGATGLTGTQLVQQALAAGHSVTAVVRNEAKMTIRHDNLNTVVGDVFSQDFLTQVPTATAYL